LLDGRAEWTMRILSLAICNTSQKNVTLGP